MKKDTFSVNKQSSPQPHFGTCFPWLHFISLKRKDTIYLHSLYLPLLTIIICSQWATQGLTEYIYKLLLDFVFNFEP